MRNTIRARAERNLVAGFLDVFSKELVESQHHDTIYRHGFPSPRTIVLGGKIELCKKLLG